MLSHCKILDFTMLLPGPFATMHLADLGADVIKVEPLDRLDLMRQHKPQGHEALNRNKRSLGLNLRNENARKVILDLVPQYDIVIEQFRPGVMKRLGLDYDSLCKINPNIIYVSLTGFGQDGPLAQKAGHDINFAALSGISSFTGSKEHGPGDTGLQWADIGGGTMYLLLGLLSAIIHRQKTGKGQYVDVSMLEGSLSNALIAAADFLVAKKIASPQSDLLNGGTFYGHYKTSDGRYLAVGSLEPKFLKLLADGLDCPQILETSDNQKIRTLIEKRVASHSLQHWIGVFDHLDACVDGVLNMEEVLNSRHVKDRQIIVDIPDNQGATQQQVGHPVRYSAFEPSYHRIGGIAGSHTREILKELDYNEEQILELLGSDS